MATLPPPRHLVRSLISSLGSISDSDVSNAQAPPTTANPLKDASPEPQKALLTLHVLFPNELLPALDLLDRGLVTRFILCKPHLDQDQQAETDVEVRETDEKKRRRMGLYYVRSAQPQTRHRSAITHTTSYEVRLDSWSCSCPAFAFAAFPKEPTTTSLPSELSDRIASKHGNLNWTFGGLSRGNDMPTCKHLLACVLVEWSEMFRSFAEEREVSVEELAGWAAGWGD